MDPDTTAPLRATARRPPALYRGGDARALSLLGRAPVVRVAGTDADGAPVLRALNAVLVDDAICFHGGRVGEKVGLVGREVVIAADEHVATLPSHFFDPERACPATTYYRSAMAWGVPEAVEDLDAKARVLGALMERHQPEGGYAPIRAGDARYTQALRGLLVARVRPRRLECREKLGQNKPREVMERVLEGLWRRGAPGDLEALEAVRRAHPEPLAPPFLHHGDVRFEVAPDDVDAAVALLEGSYWNVDVPRETVARAHRESAAWVLARDGRGPVATARAVGDAKRSWIYDVAVRPDARGRGVGRATLRLLLDHPRLRGVRQLLLATRDAQGLYARLGFVETRPRFTTMSRSAGA